MTRAEVLELLTEWQDAAEGLENHVQALCDLTEEGNNEQ